MSEAIEEQGPKLAYSVDEAAKAISVSGRTIYRLIDEGDVSTCKVKGRTVIPAWSLTNYLKANETTKTKAAG